jgi:hypothetical protein
MPRAATIDAVKALRQEACILKEVVAEQALKLRRLTRPGRVWNRIPDEVRGRIVDLHSPGLRCRSAN